MLTANDVGAVIEECLIEIERLFKPHCLLTLIMRNPEADDSDMIVTRDNLEAVEACIRKLRLEESGGNPCPTNSTES